jgi:hypothetical protein
MISERHPDSAGGVRKFHGDEVRPFRLIPRKREAERALAPP